jgi:hypothetical protein
VGLNKPKVTLNGDITFIEDVERFADVLVP